MATINDLGNIVSRCPNCDGAKSSFEWKRSGQELGAVTVQVPHPYQSSGKIPLDFRLYRCAGCGTGALASITRMDNGAGFPKDIWELKGFTPEAKERLPVPKDVPVGIFNEFREAERCLEAGCYRAAAALFRSVLDKTVRANGYKTDDLRNLKVQIDAAAKDGVITKTRQLKAHEEIRVLGNDILHDEWHKIVESDVQAAHHYAQRILEDFYDDRPSVLAQLKSAGRTPDDAKPSAPLKS